jgi:hypothetical protein
MSIVAEACITYIKRIIPDPQSIPFVAKIQKARTRKGKNYFVLRTTIPKEVVEKIQAQPGDYLFLKAKKAQWFHMVDWGEMKSTWKMLPQEVKEQVFLDGLINQAGQNKSFDLGATNVAAAPYSQMESLPLIRR